MSFLEKSIATPEAHVSIREHESLFRTPMILVSTVKIVLKDKYFHNSSRPDISHDKLS